jgi:hypothetical protein
VKVTVAVPAAAVASAVRVVLCAVPGVRLNEAGLAVTPAGRPVIATATVPLKEFAAVAVTLTEAPAPPPVSESDVGERVREKSGGGAAETVSATPAVWLNVPEVPVNVAVELPAVAVLPAVRVTVFATPGDRVSVAGLAVTPVGSPDMATVTIPLNPLDAVAVTLTVWPAPPAVIAKVVGVAIREKSGAGAKVAPPPHASIKKLEKKPQPATRTLEAILRMFPHLDREPNALWAQPQR